MFGFGILSCLVFLPLVGAGFILALRGDDEATLNNARWAALATTVIVFLLSLYVYASSTRPRRISSFVEEKGWFGSGLVYSLASTACPCPSFS